MSNDKTTLPAAFKCPDCELRVVLVDENVDSREHHIRAIASLMTQRGRPTPEVEIYLRNGEYGLALAVLAEDVNHAER